MLKKVFCVVTLLATMVAATGCTKVSEAGNVTVEETYGEETIKEEYGDVVFEAYDDNGDEVKVTNIAKSGNYYDYRVVAVVNTGTYIWYVNAYDDIRDFATNSNVADMVEACW